MSAIDLIIARGFGPEVRDTVTGYQRGKDQQQAINNEQRYADQRSAADEFDLKAAQQNQAAALQERGRIAPLQAEYDATLAEIAQLEPQVRAIQAQGGQIPPELLSRAAELDGRLRTIAMRAQPVTSATELFASRGQATQRGLVKVRGPDGQPIYMDQSQAEGMTAYVTPTAPPQRNPIVVVGPDGRLIYTDPGQATGMEAPPTTAQKPVKPTEMQTKAATFVASMDNADMALESAPNFVPTPMQAQAFGVTSNPESGTLAKTAANSVLTPEAQQYFQAAYEWMDPIARFRTGAAMPASEFANYYRTYFPMAGDSPATLKQKAQARKVAKEAIRKAAGPGPAGGPPSGGAEDPLGIR